MSSPDSISGTEGSDLYFTASGTAVGGSMTSYPFNASDWVADNNAYLYGGYALWLTNSTYRTGQYWNKNKIDISRDFVITSQIYFGSRDSDGGEGLAFVLQPTGTNANASGYYSNGYYGGNISNAVVLDFDTRVSSSSTLDYVYPTTIKNGVRYQSNNTRKLLGQIEDGKYHNVTISWNANSKTLTASVDGSELIDWNIDMVSEVFGQNEVYFGFTASTTNYWNAMWVTGVNVSGTFEGEGSGNVVFDWQVSTDSAACLLYTSPSPRD